jgi:ribosomal protein L7/L12
MAILGICKCCGNNVSNEAIMCPHCGQPDPYMTSNPPDGPWSVILTDAGNNKIVVIKLVRELTALGLYEAKNLVDSLPQVVCKGVNKLVAERLQQRLSNEGATSEIR